MKTRCAACLAAFGLLAVTSALNAQTAHAGATIPVGSGFTDPYSVAVDGNGNVFVADTVNDAVKEIVAVNGVVSSSSTVSPVGGGFLYPSGVAVDGNGNVFVADTGHNAVKEIVAVNGVVSSSSTVNSVGSGFNQPRGVAVDESGNVFVADFGNAAVKEIVAVNGVVSSGSTVNPIGSGFSDPSGVAVDRDGNVFVADDGNNALTEIVAVNGAVSSSSTVNPVGSGFSHPSGVAVDGSGNVFVADTGDVAAKEIMAANGVVSSSSRVTTLASGFTSPTGIAVDGDGNVFVGDYYAPAVYEIVAGSQKFPTTPVGSASAALTIYFMFDSAGSLAATPYVVLTQGAQNLDFRAAATQESNACVSGQAYNAGDICAVSVAFTPTKPYQRIGAVQLIGSAGTPIATFNLRGTGTGPQVIFPSNSTVSTLGSGFHALFGVAVDGSGDVLVADSGNNAVKEIVAVNGVVSSSSTVTTVGSGFSNPLAVAVDGSGNVFVADEGNSAVKEIVAVNGVVSSSSTVNTLGGGFSTPDGVAVDGSGNVFVGDANESAVKEIVAVNGVVSSGSPVNTVGGGFHGPAGVAVDSSGNVFVADEVNSAVKEIVAANGVVSPTSTVKTVGSGFYFPYGVAVDGSGNVFVGDWGHSAVKEIVAVNGVVSSTSTVITLGGGFNGSAGVAVDSGNVFVADYRNGAVKEIDRRDPPSLSFASTPVGLTSSDSPQSVEVENSGNTRLAFSGLTVGGNFAQSSGSGTPPDCSGSSSLAADAICNLSISFTPTASGSLSSTAVLTDNALNGNPATQTIPLSGAGIALTQTITFNPIPNQVQGTTLTLTATASSGLPVSYMSSTPAVCSVAGATATFVNPGTCSIVASQLGNSVYSAATPVSQSFAVISAANFTITAIPPMEVVYRERLGGVILKLQSVNGFNANVSLQCSGGPSGTKCADLPQTVHVNGTAYAFSGVLFPAKTIPGTYVITFIGASGSLSNSTTAKFIVK